MPAEPGRAVPRSLLDFGSGPEEGGGAESLVDDGFPERLPEPPLRLVVLHREGVAGNRIDEMVVDDAVVGRIEACDDRVVVGEGKGGEDGYEPGLCLGAISDQAADVGCGGLELVSIAEPVGGDEENDGAGELGERSRRVREIRGRISGCSSGGGGEEEEGESGRGCYGGAGDEEGGEEVGGVVRSSDARSGIIGGDGGEKSRGRVRRIKINSGGLWRRRGKNRYVRRNTSHRQSTKVAPL